MKTNLFRHLLLAGALSIFASGEGYTQTIINLTQDAAVQSAGTYTYYARGNASASSASPTGGLLAWSSKFYPNSAADSHHSYNGLYGPQSNAGPIGFSTGYLTDNNSATQVAGFIDQAQYLSAVPGSTTEMFGSSDILFDLGSDFVITSVTVTYYDTSGHRIATVNPQQIYTSLSVPASDADLSLFGSTTATVMNTSGATFSVSGAGTTAQYVDLRLAQRVSMGANTGSFGAYIQDVNIYGYAAVPEPASVALLAISAFGIPFLARGARRNRARYRLLNQES